MLFNDIQQLESSLVLSRDFSAIASALSTGRTEPKPTSIGKGTIVGVLGITAGNAFLDVIESVSDYRHIKDVIKNESFDVSLAVSQAGIDAMVPAVLTQEQANALKALGTSPVVITAAQVEVAMKNNDGSYK